MVAANIEVAYDIHTLHNAINMAAFLFTVCFVCLLLAKINTGGFATKAEAVDAQELLRTKGFRRPELAVWYDGEYTNLTRTPEAEMAVFRVEISSEQNLSDAVKQAIAQPGGTVRDEDSIRKANESGIPMLFTGMRHFKH